MWMMTNANGYTLDTRQSRFDAVVWNHGRVVAVGQESELRLQLGQHIDRVINVEGATVLPGFIDSHLHVAALGEQTSKLDLTGTRSASELLARVHNWAMLLPADAWVEGGGWDDNRFDERLLPTLDELDAAAGGRPVLLTRICHHAYLANRAAFAKAGLGQRPADIPDGSYGRDANGELSGIVYENAALPLLRAIPAKTFAQWKDAVRIGMQQALAAGITTVHTDDVRSLGSFDAVWTAYHSLIHEEGVRLRVHELVDWHVIDECREVLKTSPAPDEWLEHGAAKLFADGAMGGRTAWLGAPYTDAPGWYGSPMYDRETLLDRVRIAHQKGFGAAVHAIGDAAVDMALAAFGQAPPVAKRDRLVHAELIRPDLVERMQTFGEQLAIDIQPRFTVSDFPWIVERVGIERAAFACAWNTLQQANLHLAGGSDAPIEPVSPMLGMHAAIARRLPGSDYAGYQMQEALDVVSALRLFGHNAAFAAGREHEQGTITRGWLADFTVVSEDVVANPEALVSAQVQYTIVGGHVAYSTSGAETEVAG